MARLALPGRRHSTDPRPDSPGAGSTDRERSFMNVKTLAALGLVAVGVGAVGVVTIGGGTPATTSVTYRTSQAATATVASSAVASGSSLRRLSTTSPSGPRHRR